MPETTSAAAAEPLMRHGREMRSQTTNGNTPMDVSLNLKHRGHQFVALEPGDGTRYEFHLIALPHDPETLLVVRDIGGEPKAAFIGRWLATYDMAKLSNNNEWTHRLLTWWFGLLFAAMET